MSKQITKKPTGYSIYNEDVKRRTKQNQLDTYEMVIKK